ncbi:MAG: histidine phosphatase family protein, partial [Burkholderiales bacterium]
DLILWRHAEAVDAVAGLSDAERALTTKGERDARRMAEWLNNKLPDDVVILVSPARRTQQTANALRREFDTVTAIGTDAEPADVLKAARWPRASQSALIVGHQPTLGRVASLLLTGAAGDLSLKKGAVWWITGRERGGRVQPVLRVMMAPDML